MNGHDYSPAEALGVLLRKLEAADRGLAAQVRAAIDAGKDVDEVEPSDRRRSRQRSYRKTVALPEQEALQAAVDVLRAHFIEQPMFVASAMEDFRPAAEGEPGIESGRQGMAMAPRPEAGRDNEKSLEIELRAETQLTAEGDEVYRLSKTNESALNEQRDNLSRVRALLTFDGE